MYTPIHHLSVVHSSHHTDAIVNGPGSARAQPGQWANFTCTVDCSRDIDWYVEGYRSDISEECVDTGNNMMVCTRILQDCSTSMSTSGRTQQLSIMANTDIAGLRIAVQCAAILEMYDPVSPDPCNPYIVYSRLAYLNGEFKVRIVLRLSFSVFGHELTQSDGN